MTTASRGEWAPVHAPLTTDALWAPTRCRGHITRCRAHIRGRADDPPGLTAIAEDRRPPPRRRAPFVAAPGRRSEPPRRRSAKRLEGTDLTAKKRTGPPSPDPLWPPFAWSGLPGRDPSAVHPPRFQHFERPKDPPRQSLHRPRFGSLQLVVSGSTVESLFACFASWLHLAP